MPRARAPATEGEGRRAARLQETWQEVTAAVDAIRARFGRASVGTGAMVGEDGIEVPARRTPRGGRRPSEG